MSESESFIQEVSDDLRRDRLFAAFRRYGWIAILAVLLVVGGAAWNEWRKAQDRAAAQAFGDALLAALEADAPEARIAALEGVQAEGAAADLLALLTAAERLTADDRAAAAEALRPLAQSTAAPVAYSDLAALKLVLLGDDGADAATRAQLLDRLAQPGAPYRLLALEQQALALAAAGDTDAARAAAEAVLQEPDLTPGVADRIAQLLVTLGAPAEAG
jgi:hypothetical protein